MLTGGRLVAAILMLPPMIGAMVTGLDDARFLGEDRSAPIVAAALIGFAAGLSQLGGDLGAAVVAVMFGALIHGFRSAWSTQVCVRFDAPIEVCAQMIRARLTVLETAASRRTLAAPVVGALTAGIIAGYFNRFRR